jgi:hypothetical protein
VGALSGLGRAGGALARLVCLTGLLASCSPEADRVRDGGPGADPGNTDLVDWPPADPQAADTTLWPGRAPTPVERLGRGAVPPPTYPRTAAAPGKTGETPVTPNVPPSAAQQRTFDRSRSPDPRRPSDGGR